MIGFLILHRRLLDWEWYKDTNTKSLFIHCLLKCNWEDKNWKGIIIERGSFITSVNTLSFELGLTIQQIRSAIKKLENSKQITIKTTNKNTLLSVVKYDHYQKDFSNDNKQNDTNLTQEQQTKKIKVTTTKEYNNNTIEQKTKECINSRKLKFSATLQPFLNLYGKDLLNEFYKYWTEPNLSGTKFRKELEKTWSLERRLETWAKNDKNFNNGKPTITTAKPKFRNTINNIVDKHEQAKAGNFERELSEDAEFEVVE